jgi:hypothetical protein
MSDEEQKPLKPGDVDPSDADIEQEVRSERRFSLAEAIARGAGDLLKSASPVSRRQQIEFQLEEFIERYLQDTEGALRIVLLRLAKESAELWSDDESPADSLAGIVEKILGSEAGLRHFVTEVDTEWGRIYSERPHFERDHRPPDARDPYTLASVRATLGDLLEDLRR